MNGASQILRLTRAGETAWGELPGNDWTVFQANHSTYEPLEWANRNDNFQINESKCHLLSISNLEEMINNYITVLF